MSERTYVVIGFLLFLIGMLEFTYDVMSQNLSIKGQELYSLQQKIKVLDEENASLKEKLWNAESFATINEKAKKMGFTNQTRYFIIK